MWQHQQEKQKWQQQQEEEKKQKQEEQQQLQWKQQQHKHALEKQCIPDIHKVGDQFWWQKHNCNLIFFLFNFDDISWFINFINSCCNGKIEQSIILQINWLGTYYKSVYVVVIDLHIRACPFVFMSRGIDIISPRFSSGQQKTTRINGVILIIRNDCAKSLIIIFIV